MAKPTFAEDCKTFLQQLRRLKATVGNMTFRAQLGWSETRYWKTHAELFDKGRIVKGRGRGGSVQAA